MPLQRQQIEFPLGGLDEETAPLVRGPGTLDRALNVVFDKTGRLRKRRGYRYVELQDAESIWPQATWRYVKATTHRNELVVFCTTHVVSVPSPEGEMNADSTTIVRYPIRPVTLSVEYLTTGPVSDRGGVA